MSICLITITIQIHSADTLPSLFLIILSIVSICAYLSSSPFFHIIEYMFVFFPWLCCLGACKAKHNERLQSGGYPNHGSLLGLGFRISKPQSLVKVGRYADRGNLSSLQPRNICGVTPSKTLRPYALYPKILLI